MFEYFFPDELASSAYSIDYEGLYEEGCRGLRVLRMMSEQNIYTRPVSPADPDIWRP